MFLQACVCPQGGRGVCLSACWDTPLGQASPPDQAPPRPDTHPRTRHHSPRDQTPPWKADCSIRLTSGWYASYWNAFLLNLCNSPCKSTFTHYSRQDYARFGECGWFAPSRCDRFHCNTMRKAIKARENCVPAKRTHQLYPLAFIYHEVFWDHYKHYKSSFGYLSEFQL